MSAVTEMLNNESVLSEHIRNVLGKKNMFIRENAVCESLMLKSD